MASGDGMPDLGRRKERPDNDGADRCDASAEPAHRAGVRPVALGSVGGSVSGLSLPPRWGRSLDATKRLNERGHQLSGLTSALGRRNTATH
jgi:hypothetical protein